MAGPESPWLSSRKPPVESLSAPIEGATSARLKPRSHSPSSQRWACHYSTRGPGHHKPLQDGGQGLGKPNPLCRGRLKPHFLCRAQQQVAGGHGRLTSFKFERGKELASFQNTVYMFFNQACN